MIARRSLLFAPANRPEVHAKAIAAGPDIICLDLEDAVPPSGKDAARAIAAAFLAGEAAGPPERCVRVNTMRSIAGIRDMAAMLEAKPSSGVILLPKVMEAGEVRLAHDLLAESAPGLMLGVLIETADGLENVSAILSASDRIAFALFGAVDLSADLGVAMAHEPLLYARSRVVHAAARAGIDILDVPSLAFRDEAAITGEARAAKALGFTGKAAIHPAGLPAIHAVFTPSAEEIAKAEAIVAAYRASPNGLAVLDGKLVEKPVVRAMERILALRDRDRAG